ncbi:MAG: hypothetical protein ACI4RD_02095 [Kiritimatiellia bacterium]
MNEATWYLRTQDETFGPETAAKLVAWAKLGRIQPGQEVSDDNIEWRRVEDVPFLDMRFSIDIGDGNPRGPFNRAAAEALLASGRLPPTATIVETREPFPEEPSESSASPAPAPASDEGAARVEAPVERVVEREVIKEVPVEKIVEKEVRVEVPVERIVEKVVIDETRVRELEGLLAEERAHAAKLQECLTASSRNASEAAKAAVGRENALRAEAAAVQERLDKSEAALQEAADREGKYVEQVKHLEDELRRLPQAASEVAEIQAAVHSIITGEAEELARVIEVEKREFEDMRKRYADRADRLVERRHELLKRSGANIEDMTRRALLARPEDPRTAQLRKEFEEFRRASDRARLDSEAKIRELTEKLRQSKAENLRTEAGLKDVTQLRQEVVALTERLSVREKELLAERQLNEELRRQQATKQQALLARLASLESPSIGSAETVSTNQSREARQVKLPGWMSFRR